MSYARWSEHSDVYVYAETPTGVTCCGCCLNQHDGQNVVFASAEDAVAHMREHVAAGDVIPDDLLDPGSYDPDDFIWRGGE